MELKLFTKLLFLFFINEIKTEYNFNKIEKFSIEGTSGFAFFRMSNNDIIFISNEGGEQKEENFLYVYGLKSTGERFYNEENEIGYKQLNSIFLENLNGMNVKIEDKEYPLICSQVVCELIDYENNETYSQSIINFYKNISAGEEIFKFGPTNFPLMINMNQDNKILFINYFELQFNFGVTKIWSKNLFNRKF